MIVIMDNNEEELQNRQNSIHYNVEPKISLNPPGLTQVGQTIVSDKFPITMDTFWIAIKSNVIVNPFDFVTVKNLHNTRTIGIVKELQTVALHKKMINKNGTNDQNIIKRQKEQRSQGQLPSRGSVLTIDSEDPDHESYDYLQSSSITIAKVAVMANTGVTVE